MRNFLCIILLIPLVGFGQQICTTITSSTHADTIIYCVENTSCHDICDGRITVTVIGSNQPYSFSWFNGSAFIPGDNYRDSLCANQYIVSIIDANGNLVNNTYVNNLNSPPNFTVFEDSVLNPSCFNYNDGKIYLSVGGATPPYTYSWANGASTEDRDNLDSGLYVLTITDSSFCSRIDTFELINPIEVNSSTIADTLSCIGWCDGSAVVIPSDGVPPYTYQWSNGDIDSIATGLCYGSDTVVITDANGCLDTNEVSIANPDTLRLSNITIDSACYQMCDGQLSVSIEGGAPPYTTEWSFGGGIFNTMDTITQDTLCTGDYQLVFTDANTCSDTVLIPLIERDSFIVQQWVINDSCYNSCTGQIKVQLLNPQNPPFSFDWSNGDTDTITSNLCSDSLSLEIIDERMCRDTFEFFIEQGDSMYFDSISVINNRCYGDEFGTITINNVTGGVLPLIYTWSDGQITTASGINNLLSGTYSVNIEDAFGCSIDSANIEVRQPDSLFTTVSTLVNVSCFAASDGLIDIDIFGGTSAYFISWDIAISDTNYIDSLSAGEYIYTIVDDSLCELIDTVVIQEPDVLSIIDSLIIDVLCKGDSTGQIDLTVSGGTLPYEYSINGSTYQPQNYFDNLVAGSYSIIVRDANNCILTSPLYNITEPLTQVVGGLTSPNLLCFEDTGTVILTVNGGTPTYSFLWSNGLVSQNLYGVGSGNYSVVILDANGCEYNDTVIITEPVELSVSNVTTNVTCYGYNDGTATLTLSGGTGILTLDWFGMDPNALPAGNHNYAVIDANGCGDTSTFSIIEPDSLWIAYDETHIDCFGNSTGRIDVTVNGGTVPFSYAWSNLSSNVNLINIPSGNYVLIVTDSNNCLDTIESSINEPSQINYSIDALNLICNNEPDGQIIITASGGIPGYSYSINDEASYQNVGNFINLQAANYSVWIKDANGCKQDTTIILSEPVGFSTLVDIEDVEVCNGDATGMINFTLSGNTPPYNYSWSNGESTSSISNLNAGIYELVVSDMNNCKMSYSYIVGEPEKMDLVYDIQLASCEEKNDGGITAIVTGGNPPIYYQWGNGETSSDIFNLNAGTYSLYVEDSEGCSLPIEIIELGFDGFNGCIEIPTGFTPNNDNIHDEWVIYGLIDFPDVVVKVYNRWGQEVFSSLGYNKPWDGKYNGVDLPTAAYYYVIELNNSDKVFNGTVTIKR